MLLCLDIGNTNIVVAEVEQEIVNLFRLNTKGIIKKEDFSKQLISKSFSNIIISSVVPSVNQKLNEIFKELYNIEPIYVDVSMKSNIEILIDNPNELGSDLLVAGVGAFSFFGGNNIIVDLGTANKILVMIGNKFLGGAITPGFMSSFEGLFSNAELLNTIPLEIPKKVVGSNTIECIQSGSIIGTASMIEKMIEKIKKEIFAKYNVEEFKIILTGGNSLYIKDALEIKFEYMPNLLIDGLHVLYRLNYE